MDSRTLATWAVLAAMWLVACGERAAPRQVHARAPMTRSAAGGTPVDAGSTAAAQVACAGEDRRLWGTTCCEVIRVEDDERTPGEVYLECSGPQVGAACRRQADCDIACSCDPPGAPLRPGDGPRGPKDGTLGVSGVCTGQRQRGVWMCDIDEKGAVTHLIVD